MKRTGLIAAGLAIWVCAAFGYSGSGLVAAMKDGDFKIKYCNGTQAGIDSCVLYCTPGGHVTLGPGLEALSPSVTIPSTVQVIRIGKNGWTMMGPGASMSVPRWGPRSTSTTGGALRIVDGITFPLTIAGVQQAANEVGLVGGGTVALPATANIQISNAGLKVPNRVRILGLGTVVDSLPTFDCTATCNVGAIIENAVIDGSQAYMGLENISVQGDTSGTATDSVGIRMRSVFWHSYLEKVQVRFVKGHGIVIDDPGNHGLGPIQLDQVVIGTLAKSTLGDGIRIGGKTVGVWNGMTISNSGVERWGTGAAAIRFLGTNCSPSASFGGSIKDVYLEQYSDATADGIVLDGASNVVVDGISFNGAGAINYPIKIAGSQTTSICGTYGNLIRNVYANNDTILFDQVNNFAVTSANGTVLGEYRPNAKTPTILPNFIASDSLRVVQKMQIGPTTFGTLGTPGNGTVIFCSDCTIANPCAGSGTGAIAKRLNGVWVCN